MSKLDQFVTWKHLAEGLGAALAIVVALLLWGLSRAEAAVQDHVNDPNPHTLIENRFRSVEEKLDRVLWHLVGPQRNQSEEYQQ